MAASKKRVVAVAYVTKWAMTAGIKVIKNAEEVSGDDYSDRYLTSARGTSDLWVGSNDWTEDRGVAIERWRKMLERARQAARQKLSKIETALKSEPPFTE